MNSSVAEAPLIVVTDMSFHYRAGEDVLSHVNLNVGHGDAVCLVGPNGGGKSTLLKLLLGMYSPTSGSIRIAGSVPEAARLNIGYVPQYFKLDEQFPISVLDVVLMGRLRPRWSWRYSRTDRERARRALAEVDLAGWGKRSFSTLSGGLRQRVLIARALAVDPQILLLDEPLSNLDPEAQRHFYGLLKNLRRRLTILMVSHDRELVSDLFDYAVCVERHVRVHPVNALATLRQGEMDRLNLKVVDHASDACACDVCGRH